MLLLSIVQTLDAELDRLKRLREIVAALETVSPDAVNSDGVAALLASAEVSTLSSLREERVALAEKGRTEAVVEERTASALLPAAEPAPKRRKRSTKGVERRGAIEHDGASSSQEGVAPALENDRLSAKPVPGSGAAEAPKELKPSIVVVSATEAARERASRLARVPAKRAPGAHPAPRPDAAPEDLARDLAARWLTSSSSSTELLDR